MHLKSCLVECGWGATRRKEGRLKAKYQKLMRRRGAKKALVAVGHEIIVAVYHILKTEGEIYRAPKIRQEEDKTKRLNYYLTKIKELGIEIENIQLAI
jgi:hypothetical protein